MDTWNAILSRRNVRDYQDRPIPHDELWRILESGRRAPSAKNLQRWDFVLVTDKAVLAKLTRVWRGAAHVAGSAATIALVAPHPADARRRDAINYDLGQATMSMLLAATDLGIGGGHSAVHEYELASRILGLPDDRFCAYLLAFGYPAGRPPAPIRNPDRRPLDEIVHHEQW